MKSIDAVDKQLGQTLAESFLDTFARRVLLKMLQQIQVGHMTVEENGEVHCFGESLDRAELVAHISVLHPSAYRYVLFNGTIGSGEAYMLKGWRSPDLLQVIRIFVANMSLIQRMDSNWSIVKKIANALSHKFRANSKTGSRKNISAHYDLGNDFFRLFLDPTMLYSSAIYPYEGATLHEASLNKLKHICERLQLSSADHLLEIGTGWGGMAIYAAKNYGCRVTTLTISNEQYAYAKEWIEREQLSDRVTVLLKDYREVEGKYDKLVSIEMIEAVGHQYYQQYFSTCGQLLKENGLMLIQAITIADQRYEEEKHSVDFIQKYIFPGGCLPSIEVMTKHVSRDTDMQLVGLEDITLHYAQTLADWRAAFFAKLNEVKSQGFDDVFIRMWEFYLCYCEGGFRERVISTSQLLIAKPGCRQLPAVH
jgi:cyclopropane-fatty-acyl-phospholipid synthase